MAVFIAPPLVAGSVVPAIDVLVCTRPPDVIAFTAEVLVTASVVPVRTTPLVVPIFAVVVCTALLLVVPLDVTVVAFVLVVAITFAVVVVAGGRKSNVATAAGSGRKANTLELGIVPSEAIASTNICIDTLRSTIVTLVGDVLMPSPPATDPHCTLIVPSVSFAHEGVVNVSP